MSEKAIFAGGCFWCIESAFAHLDGVVKAISGLTGGDIPNPTYEQVHSENTGHREAVEIEYDPNKISYKALVEHFWKQIDPTDKDGQFVDRGHEYSTAIYYLNDDQREIAEDSKRELQNSGKFEKEIVTEILKAREFYPAEDYHQEYWKKNPERYKTYRALSGRDEFIEEKWGS